MEVKRVVIYSITVIVILYTGYLMSDYFIDRSQTALEAQKSGAPSSNKVWTLQEYETFHRYLSILPLDVDYPILSSKKSGKLFKSFIDSLDDLLYEPLQDEMIFMKSIKLKSICQNILKLYVNKDIAVQKYDNEVAYLYGIQIQILAQMQKIGKRVVEATPKDSENVQIRIKGLALMKQGTAVQISVILDLLEYDRFKDNETLLLYFKEYVPELLQCFDTQRKGSIKQRIIEVSKRSYLPSTKKTLNEIARSL